MAITLIGYRATGKSTIGKELASRLGWVAVDSDREIEQHAGKSISQIFADEGESIFRTLEREQLQRLLAKPNVVVASGGGSILDETTRHRMKESGPVIWLSASVESIINRLQSDETTTTSRPSLTNAGVVAEVTAVLTERIPIYEQLADILINTDGRPIEEIVNEIMTLISAEGTLRR